MTPQGCAERVERGAQCEAEAAGGWHQGVVRSASWGVRGAGRGLRAVGERHEPLEARAEGRGGSAHVLQDLLAERLRGIHQHPRHGLHKLEQHHLIVHARVLFALLCACVEFYATFIFSILHFY